MVKWVEEAEVWSKSSRDNSQQILNDLKCRGCVVNPAATVKGTSAPSLWPFPPQKGWCNGMCALTSAHFGLAELLQNVGHEVKAVTEEQKSRRSM